MKSRYRPDLMTPEEDRLARQRSRAAQLYYPVWRVLHRTKRLLIPKGASGMRGAGRRPPC